MPTAVQETIQVLELIVQGVPIGTNLGLLHMLWAMLTGSFLSSRGAVFPALQTNGFDEGQMRRSWSAMRNGAWTIEKLIAVFRSHVLSKRKWVGHRYEGYRPLSVDWTAFLQLSFTWQGRDIQVHGWQDVVLSECKFDPDQDTFHIWVFFDPLYEHPLVLATNVNLQPVSAFALYLDRWLVEQVPLAAKQMIGLQRQFVFAPESCLRLSELALLAGNILTYLAAVLPPMPTGFWDQHPKKRRAASAGSWLAPIFSLSTKNMADFAKRTHSPSIYPRVLRVIAAENGILDPSRHYALSIL